MLVSNGALMHRLILNSLGFIFATLFVLYFFDLINYNYNDNPDINNYSINFHGEYWSYDLGFEIYQSLLRDLLKLDFHSFWLISLVLIAVLYVINSAKELPQVPFMIINYFFLAKTFGTQIRYFIAALLFISALNFLRKKKALIAMLLASFFHYGILFVFFNYIISNLLLKKADKFKRHILAIFVSIFVVYFLSGFLVQVLLPYTRFNYYSDSFYMESKSLISLFYCFLSFSFICYYFSHDKQNIDIAIPFSIVLLYSVLCSSAIAVLSGRLLLVYLIVEPLVAKSIFKSDRRLYFIFLIICSIKALPMLYSFFEKNI
ncbi:hypothetical protein CF107_07620 [Aeromonas veronii]|nr:hypothetical protein CF107_07620 [Aeromonas veronii]